MKPTFFLFLLAYPSLAFAQSFSDAWQVTGVASVAIDAEELKFYAIKEAEGDGTTVDLMETAGFTTLNIAALDDPGTGDPGSNVISFFFGPWASGDPADVSIDYFSDAGIFMSNLDVGSPLPLASYAFEEDGTLTFTVEDVVLLEAKRTEEGSYAAVEGGATITVWASYAGNVEPSN